MLSYDLNEDDEILLTQYLKSIFGRAELKRAEFKQFIEMKTNPAKFEANDAIQFLLQLGLITKINYNFFD